jgi:cytoskeletal protein CcmA (bactofilin family)
MEDTVWRNKESQSISPGSPSAPSGRVAENSSAPKFLAKSSSPADTKAQGSSWLSPTMRVKGQISGNEDLLVDGKVEGSISVGEHRLTVGPNGQVTGGLAAREIIICGKVDGNQTVVGESIEIKKNASMTGNVTTRRIVIEDGAGFKGSIEILESSKQVDASVDSSTTRALSKSA